MEAPEIAPNAKFPEAWDELGDGSWAKRIGFAQPTTTVINTTKSATGDNEIVAAPASGYRLVVVAFIIQNESSTATTMILRSADTTNGWRVLAQNQGDGLTRTFSPGFPWKLGEAEALNLNLDGANSCGVSVMYYTEATG